MRHLADGDPGLQEVEAVAFRNDCELIVSTYVESGEDEDYGPKPHTLEVWNIDRDRVVSRVKPDEISGTMMPIGDDWVVGFHRHPKVIHLATGRVEKRWPHIETSSRLGSICLNTPPEPILALDAPNRRFAVCEGQRILVASLHLESA